MFRILKLVLLAAAANCAPATFIPLAEPVAQPLFYIGPQPQSQFQYQPLLKIQQQPLAPVTKIESPKSQYVFLYPGAAPIPLIGLRQEETNPPDYITALNNWWTDFQQNWAQAPAPAEQPTGGQNGDGKMEEMMAMEKNREMMAMEKTSEMMAMEKNRENAQPIMPASTMPLNLNKQRFYIINSVPQFYGSFAALPTTTIGNPILAIEPLRARSAIDSIPAESEKVEQIRSQDVIESVQQPVVVQPIPQLQLRGNIVEPLQRLEIEQPVVPVVNKEPVPEVAAQQLARFLTEARSQDAEPNTANKLKENDASKLRAGEDNVEEEESSIAQAKPSAIAVSGKGGVSSAAPQATAVVGDALSSPTAISLSGDFEDEETKLKLKQTEPFAPQ